MIGYYYTRKTSFSPGPILENDEKLYFIPLHNWTGHEKALF